MKLTKANIPWQKTASHTDMWEGCQIIGSLDHGLEGKRAAGSDLMISVGSTNNLSRTRGL